MNSYVGMTMVQRNKGKMIISITLLKLPAYISALGFIQIAALGRIKISKWFCSGIGRCFKVFQPC